MGHPPCQTSSDQGTSQNDGNIQMVLEIIQKVAFTGWSDSLFTTIDYVQVPKTGSEGFDNASDSEQSDSENNDDELQDVPMNNWEEFNKDAVYQKKHVNPEMWRWILTKDCQRIISNKYFNDLAQEIGMSNMLYIEMSYPCCRYTTSLPSLTPLLGETQYYFLPTIIMLNRNQVSHWKYGAIFVLVTT